MPSQVTSIAVSNAVHLRKPALRVTWTTPQSDVVISQYHVQYRKVGTSWRSVSPVTSGSTTSTVLEALDAGTAYHVRIRAVSVIGNGMWSSVESETTYMSESSNKLKVLEIVSQKGIIDMAAVEQLSDLNQDVKGSVGSLNGHWIQHFHISGIRIHP